MITAAPIVKARGLLAPTLCFCNELKAIIETVAKETAEKPCKAVRANSTRVKSVVPATTLETTLAANSAMKRISARKSAVFK